MTDIAPVLVTGASGFVGTALTSELRSRGIAFRHAVRSASALPEPAVAVGDLSGATDWSAAVRGVRTVIHLAGRAHIFEHGPGERARMFDINVAATRSLARAALSAGVARFLFLSSIKVNGDVSSAAGFTEDAAPLPGDDYAQSKLEAEEEVRAAGREGLSYTIIRAPLVYGPGVKANFRSLLGAIDRRIPLPLGGIRDNRRSLVYIGNLIDAILYLGASDEASGQTFLVGDGETVSTKELTHRIAGALGRFAPMIPVPPMMLRALGKLLRRSESVSRLIDSCAADTTKIRQLGWHPPFSMAQGLERTAAWYREQRA